MATIPIGLLVAQTYGAGEGLAVVAARMGLWALLALAAWRVGGDRGDALRDLLMHPRLRAFGRAELDVLVAVPRLVLVRAARAGGGALTYARGTFGLALALAFSPVIVSEAVAMHLLLGGGWVAWVFTALHAYMLLWLWGFALGPRCYPHRVGPRTAVLRGGALYRVAVPRSAIVSATDRTERIPGERRLVEREDAVLLPVRGRVELWLELSEPVRIQRPLGEPILTRRLAIASDQPADLIELLLAPIPAARRPHDAHAIDLGLGFFATLDVAGLTRDAAQPG